MISYVNGVPTFGQAGAESLGLGNINKQIINRLSTNPTIGSVTTRILPQTGNIYNGMRSTFPAHGAGSPVNISNADVADRVLNSSLSGNNNSHDLRRYRGLGLASGAYNDPYNTEIGYGSTYAYSNQYPDGGPFPYNGPLPYPLSGPYNSRDYDLYGYDQHVLNRLGQEIIVPDASRGFNIDNSRGFDCKYITGALPDAARGFNIDPCTGYSKKEYRGCLSNAFGGDIKVPFLGLDYNPCTGCGLGSNPCGKNATAYGTGNIYGSSPYLMAPYGYSACNEPFDANYQSTYGISVNGANGARTTDGSNGINGYNGVNGYNGYNGAQTTNGLAVNGANGYNGINGYNGANGTGGTRAAYGLPVNGANGARVTQGYASPFAYSSAGGGCKSCR